MIGDVIFTGIGLVAGFWLGREWAEMKRAQHDMRRTWRGRRGYRD